MLNATLEERPFASVAVTLTLAVLVGSEDALPVAEAWCSAARAIAASGSGVPEMVAEVVSWLTTKLNPLGRPLAVQVIGWVPPVTEI